MGLHPPKLQERVGVVGNLLKWVKVKVKQRSPWVLQDDLQPFVCLVRNC